jgi:hypothetical protein
LETLGVLDVEKMGEVSIELRRYINEHLLGLGFTKTSTNPNLYYLFDKSDRLVSIMYVDDLIFIKSSEKLIAGCNAELAQEFEMKDIGLMHCFLGLEVWWSPSEVFLR